MRREYDLKLRNQPRDTLAPCTMPGSHPDCPQNRVQKVLHHDPRRYFALLYTLPTAQPGRIVPAGCVGPIYVLNVGDSEHLICRPVTGGGNTCRFPRLTNLRSCLGPHGQAMQHAPLTLLHPN
jgi:hypothetical protein